MAYTRVQKVYVGTDISRDAQVVAGASITTLIASTGMAEGEIVILDHNKKVLAAGATVSDSPSIFIARGTKDTFNYTNEAGTTVTGARRLDISDRIEGKLVSKYLGQSYEAPTEQVVTWTPSLTPDVGTEYGLRIVYKDLYQHPGQFTHTYRVTATVATVASLIDLFVAAINSDKNARVIAVDGTTYMTLTGKVVDDNAEVDSINEYSQVNFELFPVTDNFTVASTITYTTAPKSGFGHWRYVRDIEKFSLGYKGILNRTHFPVIKPNLTVVKDETYDGISIDAGVSYTQANNQYDATTKTSYKIFVPVTATSNQMGDILAQLNPWMASLGFESLSI